MQSWRSISFLTTTAHHATHVVIIVSAKCLCELVFVQNFDDLVLDKESPTKWRQICSYVQISVRLEFPDSLQSDATAGSTMEFWVEISQLYDYRVPCNSCKKAKRKQHAENTSHPTIGSYVQAFNKTIWE